MPDIFETKEETNPVETLVGDGKKFKTVEDLAKGKIEADNFIAQLQDEMKRMREDIAQKAAGADQLDAIREELKALKANASQERSQGNPPALTVDGIKALVSETITSAERNRTVQQNILAANDAMVKAFGTVEKAFEAVQSRSKELGMTAADLRGVAEKSPSAFQKIMLDGVKAGDAPLTLRDATPPGKNVDPSTPGTKEYYENLRRTNPNVYWQPKVQMELHKAVKAGTYQL